MGLSILTVDDSSTMRQMITFTLKGANYDVVEATDGVHALEVARGKKLALIITDVNMPRMDGICPSSSSRRSWCSPLNPTPS